MARKGKCKVRTGCFTCKIRRVKCDEAKPDCLRCSKTGRVCDGYPDPAKPISLQLQLLKPLSLFPETGMQESRALEYFCNMVSPNLPGATDPYFWTHLVVQFSRYEPAVRHSIIAISSLYEDIVREEDSPLGSLAHRRRNNIIILRHYNAAIKELKEMQNPGLVLLVCILFICLEVLQGNRDAALRHCTHGIAILAGPEPSSLNWVREYLMPLFRRLTTLPFFFKSEEADRLDLDLAISRYTPPSSFSNQSEAAYMMDDIMNQVMLIIRQGFSVHIGPSHYEPISPHLLKEQDRILCLTRQWYAMLMDLEARCKVQKTSVARALMLAKYRVALMWGSEAFSRDEFGYDDYGDEFRSILDDAEEAVAFQKEGGLKPRPSFEMGFIPLLFFCAHRCRVLHLRLKALRLMRTLVAPRESLWEREGMCALARLIIEVEHGLALDDKGRPRPGAVPVYSIPEYTRVLHFCPGDADEYDETFFGHGPRHSRVVLFMRNRSGDMYLRLEVLGEVSTPPVTVGEGRAENITLCRGVRS
ncbi:uncharacterized protein GLRG_06932 [Colletotrichum graminicola M1.001]|uniref:Zn(2)-C6 fungal-type domain-containing protein n=1 Tax=Colletotrichum graminicola (strain M1.001 / M2 / FGSC 10212) TaxID=645133 RepID=E3QLA5_COLGM|nr:uncharacterized protein GLRG_06932 [Colletotrichum graminicola M1.001]EFQ31643.1 hypothetical protein GLRG_06932 [Colletotrichum graminicola M1.001]